MAYNLYPAKSIDFASVLDFLSILSQKWIDWLGRGLMPIFQLKILHTKKSDTSVFLLMTNCFFIILKTIFQQLYFSSRFWLLCSFRNNLHVRWKIRYVDSHTSSFIFQIPSYFIVRPPLLPSGFGFLFSTSRRLHFLHPKSKEGIIGIDFLEYFTWSLETCLWL